MSEFAAHPGNRPQYGREIVILLMALFVCAELAAAVFGLVYPPKWVATAMLVVIGLVTTVFALVRCGAMRCFSAGAARPAIRRLNGCNPLP